jgi:hypothetical protein
MKIAQSKFAVLKMAADNQHANFTTLNHLYTRGLIGNDTTAFGAIGFLASTYSLGQGKSPLLTLAKNADVQEVENTHFEWEFMINGYRPSLLMMDVESGNSYKGLGQSKFKIKLDVNYYVEGDVICPTDSKRYNLRVSETPVNDGDGTIYTVKLVTDDISLFVPSEFFTPGTKYTKLASTYSEASVRGGSMHFEDFSKIKFRSWTTLFRKQYSITAHAAKTKITNNLALGDKVLITALANGETPEQASEKVANAVKTGKNSGWYWGNLADIKFIAEFDREKEMALMYQRSSETMQDNETGFPVLQGPGLQELFEDGNQKYYNVFSIQYVKDFLMDIFFNRVAYDQRNIVMWTGEVGLNLFDEAIARITQGMFKDMTDFFVKQDGGSFGSAALSGLSYSETPYTMYKFKLGGSLKVMHIPAYDDKTFNTKLDENGFPLESRRFTFMNIGLGEGLGNNITYIKEPNSARYGYTAGLYNPFGPSTGGMMSHGGDWYTIHRLDQCGIMVKDITKTGELIPSDLRGY